MTWESRLLVASALNRIKVHHGVIPGDLKVQGGGKALNDENPTKNMEIWVPSSLLLMVLQKLRK